MNEARLLKQFDSEFVVKGLDYGESGGLYYLAMELLDGESVQDMMDREGTLDEDTALYIIVQIAKALEYCQQQGILHRDIKPDNIMVTREGQIKLCDLGFAKPIEAGEGEEDTTCGTPQYISPEQARGMSDVDIRADIYSLGATLFHMVTGQPPFTGKTTQDIFIKHLTHRLPDPNEINPSLSKGMGPVLKKMMMKDREERYQSLEDAWKALAELRGKPAAALKGEGLRGFTRKLTRVFGRDRGNGS